MPDLHARLVQGGRVKMYAYTSNESNVEDGMAEASLKIPVLRFSGTWIKIDCHLRKTQNNPPLVINESPFFYMYIRFSTSKETKAI